MTSSTCCSDNTDFHAGMEVPGKPSRITVLRRVLVMQERKRLTHAVLILFFLFWFFRPGIFQCDGTVKHLLDTRLMIATVSAKVAEPLELVTGFRCGIFHTSLDPTLCHMQCAGIQVSAKVDLLVRIRFR